MPRDVRPVHHPDKRHVEMPYAPALLVRRGNLLFLSGLTAAPVYHSHPHREEEFDLPPGMREQAVLLMENLKATLAAAGCTLADVVSATRYLTDVAEHHDHRGGLTPGHTRQLQDRDQRDRGNRRRSHGGCPPQWPGEAQPKTSRTNTKKA